MDLVVGPRTTAEISAAVRAKHKPVNDNISLDAYFTTADHVGIQVRVEAYVVIHGLLPRLDRLGDLRRGARTHHEIHCVLRKDASSPLRISTSVWFPRDARSRATPGQVRVRKTRATVATRTRRTGGSGVSLLSRLLVCGTPVAEGRADENIPLCDV